MTQRVRVETKVPDVDSILRFMRTKNPLPSSAGDGRNSVTAGITALSPGERAAVSGFLQKREATDEAVKEAEAKQEALAAPDGDVPTTELAAQIGRPLTSDEIKRRLRKLNSRFVFHRSINLPDIMGIYIADPEAPVYEGQRIRFIMGFEFGFSPEFTVRHPEAKTHKKLTRGWRSILLRLAKDQYIEFAAACRAFDVERGRTSAHWKREVEMMKRPAMKY